MTQPQAQQKPFFPEPPSCSAESLLATASRFSTAEMDTACNQVDDLAARLDTDRSLQDQLCSKTAYFWFEQLEAAAKRMERIARHREALGE